MYERYGKRTIDFIISLISIIILSPILVFTAILVRIKLGSPILFRQARPGKDECIFQLYKFRSMTNEMDEAGKLLPDAKRLTKFGKFLRASSMDELPELINILKGDMSIVGPRPLSIYYLPHYSKEQRKRHAVRPGLTGLAQINGRNNLDWDKRFALDLEYVNKISFLSDIRIILGTVLKVFKREDIVVRGENAVMDFGPYSVLKEERNNNHKMSDSMTYSEIGSYFWFENLKHSNQPMDWLPKTEDSTFCFSGRAAIELALIDILDVQDVRVLYAPSYCCISMLQSFIDKNIRIEFYDVDYVNGQFQYQYPRYIDSNSVALIMSYFGDKSDAAHELIRYFHEQGSVVVEDLTHSLFSDGGVSDLSDYYVVALRKWFPTPAGGWVGKRNGLLRQKPYLESNYAVAEKVSAMKEKADYLQGKVHSKENFLLQSAKFENDLIHVDRMLKIDDVSMGILMSFDISGLMKQRKDNCKFLLHGLKDLDGELLSLPTVDLESVTPLFLPIFMETEKRDSLRAFLIQKGVYCPVHWPEVMGASVGVRANELSLICDQRYSLGDMQVIVDAIHSWANAQ